MPYARELTVPSPSSTTPSKPPSPGTGSKRFISPCRATADAIKEATGQAGTVSTRFTHVYPDGPAPYYTFNAKGTPGRVLEQWRHIKTRAPTR